ncbi:MAG: MBL fold metallo-hydrolase [Caldilineae bacterium]|nr:MAG: MBL fold metallo-hydrolase [Caldilineae bacterium]
MTELIFLGVGAIRPAVPGDHTALLIRYNEKTLLLDAGPALMVQLERASVEPEEISHVYFSHQHGDHTLGSPILLFHHRPRYYLAAAEVLRAWRKLLEIAYPRFIDTIADEIILHPLPVAHPHVWPELPGVCARLALVYHSRLPAFALRLDFACEDEEPFSIVYTGDTAATERVSELARGADLLIHEATYLTPHPEGSDGIHSSAFEAGQIAQAADVRALALTHRLAGDPEAWRAEAARAFSGTILIPMAGDRLRLPQDLPQR